MLENNMIIKVTNRSNSYVGYCIPEMQNLNRKFAPNESKDITMEELRKLSWTPGGLSIITNHLIINNEEAVKEILVSVEPEYFYNINDVEKLLTHGTLDQVKDALDFAPEGVVQLMKDVAVSTKLNDVAKREAIKDKTNFDVTKAIEFNEISNIEEDAPEKQRRSAPITTEPAQQTGGRRASAPVITIKTNNN